MRLGLMVLVLVGAGCVPHARVSLLEAIPVTAPVEAELEVRTRSSGVPDPLPLAGGGVAFEGLEEPLGHAVATAVVPWAAEHRVTRPGGWRLLLELVHASARREDGRTVVSLGVRATLRARTGNVYLAQTQAHCQEAALVPPTAAAPVFYRCMSELGRELAGWLGGITTY